MMSYYYIIQYRKVDVLLTSFSTFSRDVLFLDEKTFEILW